MVALVNKNTMHIMVFQRHGEFDDEPVLHVVSYVPVAHSRYDCEYEYEVETEYRSYPHEKRDEILDIAKDLLRKAKVNFFEYPHKDGFTSLWNIEKIVEISVQDEGTDDEPYAYITITTCDDNTTYSDAGTLVEAWSDYNKIKKQVKKHIDNGTLVEGENNFGEMLVKPEYPSWH